LFAAVLLISCEIATELKSDTPYIIFTFDDQHESIYNTALPVMVEFGFRATNVINTGLVGEGNNLTWSQVEELEFEHNWETAGHTLHHISLPTVPIEVAEYEIYHDWLNLIEHGLSHSTFALPSGIANQTHYDIIQQYYQNIRTSQNLQIIAPIDRINLGYFVYLSEYTAENVKSRILQAKRNKNCVVIIGFHRIMEDTGDSPTNCKPDDFYEIVKFISDNELSVLTIDEACELFSAK